MKTKQQKIDTAALLFEKLSRAKSVVLTDYKGLTMKQLSDLRNKLADVQGEFTITKNTILEHALPPSIVHLPPSSLEGPTATLLAYDDQITPIKLLVKALKDAGIGKIKAGFLGTELLDEVKINQLASLPTKNELQGKIIGVLAAPLQGMIGVLNGNLKNLVYALDQISKLASKNEVRIQKGGV